MRLIDADALIKQIEADAEQMEGPIAKMFTYASISDVKHAPTIEPEPKRGSWYAIEKGDKGYSAGDFKCSICGEPNHTWIPKPKYCPNCGARMD